MNASKIYPLCCINTPAEHCVKALLGIRLLTNVITVGKDITVFCLYVQFDFKDT